MGADATRFGTHLSRSRLGRRCGRPQSRGRVGRQQAAGSEGDRCMCSRADSLGVGQRAGRDAGRRDRQRLSPELGWTRCQSGGRRLRGTWRSLLPACTWSRARRAGPWSSRFDTRLGAAVVRTARAPSRSSTAARSDSLRCRPPTARFISVCRPGPPPSAAGVRLLHANVRRTTSSCATRVVHVQVRADGADVDADLLRSLPRLDSVTPRRSPARRSDRGSGTAAHHAGRGSRAVGARAFDEADARAESPWRLGCASSLLTPGCHPTSFSSRSRRRGVLLGAPTWPGSAVDAGR